MERSCLSQEFSFVKPSILTKIINIFSTSFYCSGLCSDCEKLYKSWNVTIRQAFNVDRCTHRYLIETIFESMHPKVMLASRYVTFYNSLIHSSKLCVRLMAKLCQDDLRTVLGRTLATLANVCNLSNPDLLTSQCVKRNLTYFAIPDNEEWRRNSVLELLQLRDHGVNFTP